MDGSHHPQQLFATLYPWRERRGGGGRPGRQGERYPALHFGQLLGTSVLVEPYPVVSVTTRPKKRHRSNRLQKKSSCTLYYVVNHIKFSSWKFFFLWSISFIVFSCLQTLLQWQNTFYNHQHVPLTFYQLTSYDLCIWILVNDCSVDDRTRSLSIFENSQEKKEQYLAVLTYWVPITWVTWITNENINTFMK